MPESLPQKPPKSHYIAWLKSQGVKVVFEFQPGGVESYAAFINDPDGNVIEVFDSENLVCGRR